jgi:hypothetical protein
LSQRAGVKALPLLLTLGLVSALCCGRKPSAVGIAREMEYDRGIVTYCETEYYSDWGAPVEVAGHLRVKDRHWDDTMPIVTYDLIVTWGEFSDPDIVRIRSGGGGNYFWRADKRPDGDLTVYHTVPGSVDAQVALDDAETGAEIRITGRISSNNRIEGDDGSLVGVRHSNHKFILVEDVSQEWRE